MATPQNLSPTIRLHHVSWDPVLTDVDLGIAPGEILALMGPSGSGKTTLLRLVLGFLQPSHGTVALAGRTVSGDGAVLLPPEERNLAVVFQDLALWPHLTVWGNLEFGLKAKGFPSGERAQRIRHMLQRLDLVGFDNRYPGSLSGGERQRVAIARALVLKPLAILLDEPLANLDVMLKWRLLSLFREVLIESQVAAIYITHDPREAIALANRIAVLEDGQIVQVDIVDEMRRAPATEFVRQLFE